MESIRTLAGGINRGVHYSIGGTGLAQGNVAYKAGLITVLAHQFTIILVLPIRTNTIQTYPIAQTCAERRVRYPQNPHTRTNQTILSSIYTRYTF